ncbi:MAG: bifunctional demethylmenaquinone methyltransferase/2-methoxy-6-polyprenyl-1,4-benzoquinol methylase UbiE [Chlamydiota bacterium]
MPEPSREKIWEMFNDISPTYDWVNTVLSLGLHQHCRKKLVEHLPQNPEIKLLDLATGTGDQIVALMESTDAIDQAIGIDPAEQMLQIGRAKIQDKFYDPKVELVVGNSENLPFEDEVFDVVTISFGIRNVQSIQETLTQAKRVLKRGGKLLVLEFSLPENRWVKPLYLFYLKRCLPWIGGCLSGNFSAYRYLNRTIETFPYGSAFLDILSQGEWYSLQAEPLVLGTMHIYSAEKGSV